MRKPADGLLPPGVLYSPAASARLCGSASRETVVWPKAKDGTILKHEVEDCPGMPSDPFTWKDAVEKFDELVADRIDSDLGNEIKDTVLSLEHIKVSDLMALLARIRADFSVNEACGRQGGPIAERGSAT
jgi:hypothetical protein